MDDRSDRSPIDRQPNEILLRIVELADEPTTKLGQLPDVQQARS